MILLKCLSFTTILLLVLVIETIIDAAPNPDPFNELSLNIKIEDSNQHNGTEPKSKQGLTSEIEPTPKPLKTEPKPKKEPTSIKCPKEKGFCVRPDGGDQNSGVIKLDDVNGATAEQQEKCLSKCLSHPGATGCEVIWNQWNRGCYVHTRKIDRGNGVHNHACWVFSKCKGIQCGVKKPSSNEKTGIYFGEDAEMNEYPWIAALQVDDSYPHCGGSLIASQWVLTAHHCVVGARRINVILGEHILNEQGESEIEKRFKVKYWFTFDNGDNFTGQDVALLKLRKPVDLEIYTPVCLPTDADDMDEFIGKDAWVYGWGRMEDYNFPNTLQKVQIEVVSNAECSEALEENGERPVTAGEVCAGDRSVNQTKDSCSGDSGGPLSLAHEEDRHTQIGIVSWGIDCGLPGLFGVYTNVVYFKDWIRETMANN